MEKEMATHPRILAWESPWTEEPGELQSMGLQESGTTEQLNTHIHANSRIISKRTRKVHQDKVETTT